MTSAEQFLDHLLSSFFIDMQSQQSDNYDWDRFSADGIDCSDIPYTALHIETLLAVTRQTEQFFQAYNLLQDEASKALFLELLRYKLAGHKHVRLSRNNAQYAEITKQGKNYPSIPSDTCQLMGYTANLNTYDLVFDGHRLHFKALQILWPFLFRQYYFARDGVVIKPEKGDYVIDGGASLGDTSLAFGASVGSKGYVYLFEILESHIKICEENLRQNEGLSRFKLLRYGLSDKMKAACPCETANSSSFDFGFELNDDDPRFALTTIDQLVLAGEVERVDFIKMDIEGSELRALKGAENTLRRFKPKLAISLYHKIKDFYEIPLYLDGLGLGYRFYLDHYTIHVGETVLYAVAPENA